MQKKYIVNKFGGAIMSSRETLENAKKHLISQLDEGFLPIVVVSAFSGVTDALQEIFKEIENLENQDISKNLAKKFVSKIRKINNNTLTSIGFEKSILNLAQEEINEIYKNLEKDINAVLSYGLLDVFEGKILSYGEKISSIYFKYFLENGTSLKIKKFSGEEIGILTDQKFLDANIGFDVSQKNVLVEIKSLEKDTIPIITGFSGKTPSGQTSTLGRGGSDTTATFLGAALGVRKIILWKNVPGVLSADPHIVKNAKTIENISYSQAEESGKVICVKAMKYIQLSKIPCEVTYINDKNQKTLINPQDKLNKKGMKLVGVKRDLILLNFKDESVVKHGFLAKIANVVGDFGVNMVFISNTKEMIYIVVENIEIEKLNKMLIVFRNKGIEVTSNKVNVIVGIGNFDWDDVKKFNDVLYKSELDIIIGAFPYKNNVRLESVIAGDKKEIDKVLNKLHDN